MRKALVLGAGGFIGSHLIKRLKREGFWVRGVDLKYPEFGQTEADDFIIGDLRDPNIVKEVMLPPNHLSGSGCRNCFFIKNGEKKRIKNEIFIKRATIIHGDKYRYYKSNYIGNRKKIKIICKKHGVFEQTPISHLRGSGCPDCFVKSGGETQIANYLDGKGIRYKREKRFASCKNINSLPVI